MRRYKLVEHQDDAVCRALRLIADLRAIDLVAPSEVGASVNTVQMLAKHAGIELEKYPIRWYDHGGDWEKKMLVEEIFDGDTVVKKDRIPVPARFTPALVYVAPLWLCKVATTWRRKNNKEDFPRKLLGKLQQAKDDERARSALIAELTILHPKRKR